MQQICYFCGVKTIIGFMKVSELKRLLRLAGCYETRIGSGGHDEWYSPTTDMRFRVPRHQSKEIATGTLNSIMKAAGLK